MSRAVRVFALKERLWAFYSPEEAETWFSTPQRLLSGDTPNERIRAGQIDDVEALVAQLEDGAFV